MVNPTPRPLHPLEYRAVFLVQDALFEMQKCNTLQEECLQQREHSVSLACKNNIKIDLICTKCKSVNSIHRETSVHIASRIQTVQSYRARKVIPRLFPIPSPVKMLEELFMNEMSVSTGYCSRGIYNHSQLNSNLASGMIGWKTAGS